MIAQQLYEGIEVKGRGTIGLVSYIRTDSVRISDEARAASREFIEILWASSITATTSTKTERRMSRMLTRLYDPAMWSLNLSLSRNPQQRSV